jgi:hypothetical protein
LTAKPKRELPPTEELERALNLSSLQIEILHWLLMATEHFEKTDSLGPYGILWKDYPVSREGQASNDRRAVSRSLIRLEARGLLLRMDYRTQRARLSHADAQPKQTTSVKLTRMGHNLALMIKTEKNLNLPKQ